MNVLKTAQTEIFEHLGIANNHTTGRARDLLVNIFKQGRQQFADAFGVSESQWSALLAKRQECLL
jgi:hypothetical protein